MNKYEGTEALPSCFREKNQRKVKPATSCKDASTYVSKFYLGLKKLSILLASNASGNTTQGSGRLSTNWILKSTFVS